MKLPFFQMYPSDYLRDTRVLSLAAKGGWFDVLCMLHSSSIRGTMTLPLIGWARVMAATVDQAEAVVTELDGMKVADVTRHSNGDVTLSSRRMLREHISREQTRLRVARYRARDPCNAPETGQKTETKKLETKNTDVGRTKPPKSSATAEPTSDEEWLNSLLTDPAYAVLNVRLEYAKMKSWCLHNNRQPTRRRFINWLNRCDRPMTAQSGGTVVPWQRDSHNSDHAKGF